ncbi:4Fe-4S ferredoxin iron-sulfur binding domain-containing protein [Thioalkalivibrio nitratireducens DSM 14787]|uniref:4Fe-4S ferredoxin iron-sulfur binding domain-containing protein n=1 Tax=Thioalkalivibrio nitratireducens (strain DSM 14787 / UNIQEM 213 / ALEN2) TaxID=1255043 RepID=L0DU68_THIND|nr:4Fe-4S dicluster domain-containing protein [Thioalkalivibrio nitratireducens]AGA32540.1 4Fe-4S ferredoxin iron-sulfur binding domain-containing protein [Thioalkalivibrio nitratireducens DSM 14787]
MSNESSAKLSRRQFITGAAAAVAGLTVAPGVFLLKPADAASPNSDKPRWGLLIDTSKCADGCTACVRACHEENGVRSLGRPKTDAQWIRKVNLTDQASGHEHSLPVMCQHCEHPPCVDVCPTKASFIRPDGIVLVDKHTCIGCRYCMMACPYKARSFIHEPLTDQKPHAPRGKGTVESCTLCVHKVDRGDGTTACAEACNRDGHGAMVFGDLNDPDSEISQRLKQYGSTAIRADLRLNPGVRYQGI